MLDVFPWEQRTAIENDNDADKIKYTRRIWCHMSQKVTNTAKCDPCTTAATFPKCEIKMQNGMWPDVLTLNAPISQGPKHIIIFGVSQKI